MVGRPSGFTEPEKPAPPSVTADGAPVRTGVGDPGVGAAVDVKVAVKFVSAFIITWHVPVPEHPPPLQPRTSTPTPGER